MKLTKSLILLVIAMFFVSFSVSGLSIFAEEAIETAESAWIDSDFVVEGTVLRRLSAKGQEKWNSGNHNIVIDNNDITEIADYFAASASLFETDGSLVINSTSLQRIGEQAFYGVAFRSIAINSPSLTTIDSYAFYTNASSSIVLNAPNLTRLSGWSFFGRIGLDGAERLENLDFSKTGINFVGKETFTDTRLITLVPIKVNDHKIAVQNAAFGNKGEVDNGNPFAGWGGLFGGAGTSTTPYIPIFFAPVNSTILKPYAETTYAAGDTAATTAELTNLQEYKLIRPYTVEFMFWEEQSDGSLKEIAVSDDVVNTLLASNGTQKPEGYDSVRTDKDGRTADFAINSYTNTRGVFTLTDVEPDSYTVDDFPLDRNADSPNSFNTTYYPVSQDVFNSAKEKLVMSLANVKQEGETYNYEAPVLEGYTFSRVSDEYDSSAGSFTSKPIRIDYIYKKEVVKVSSLTVNYVDEDGNVLQPADVTDGLTVGSEYDTSSKRLSTIVKDGKTYVLAKVADDSLETGIISEDGTIVTYIYKMVFEPASDSDSMGSQTTPNNSAQGKKTILPRTNSNQSLVWAIVGALLMIIQIWAVFTRKRGDE